MNAQTTRTTDTTPTPGTQPPEAEATTTSPEVTPEVETSADTAKAHVKAKRAPRKRAPRKPRAASTPPTQADADEAAAEPADLVENVEETGATTAGGEDGHTVGGGDGHDDVEDDVEDAHGDEDESDPEDDGSDDGEDEDSGEPGEKQPPKRKRERKEMRRERFGVQTTLEPPPFGPSVMLVEESVGDECRVAVLESGRMSHYFAERESTATNVGSIYKGRVANVEPAIQAAFVDFGQGQNGFLHVSDLHPKYFPGGEVTERVGKKIARRDRPMIQDALKRGQEIIVQVIKEGIGTKGPTVTSYISIPGRLLVMMPDMDKAGVSRKVADEDQRRAMRKILDSLELPDGCGFILRTAGLDRSKSELQRDAAYLERLWTAMRKRMDRTGGPCELYTEGDLLIRTLRDLADPCIKAIVVDTPAAFDRAQIFMDIVAPGTGPALHYWNKSTPLFTAFRVEEQIAMIHAREVPLPSGGALVFDEAEALVAIDVNSGRSRAAKDSETNAYQTNLEAVDEITRQLRLRDVGGLIINDLIDMRLPKHRRAVEERFAALLKRDRAKTTLLPISDLGMAEMTRQRMRPSQRKANYTACPHCQGSGEIRMPDVVVADIVRLSATLLSHQHVKRVEAVCSVRVASEMLGRGRRLINALEDRLGKLVDVRISEAFSVDRFEVYAYDERGADIEIDRLPIPSRPVVADLPLELTEEAELELDAESESPRRRRRRRKPAPADATAIALAGGFDDLPPIDMSETPLLETLTRREREAEPKAETHPRESRRRGSRDGDRRGGRDGERRADRDGERQPDRDGERRPGRDRERRPDAAPAGDSRPEHGDAHGGRRRRGKRRGGPQQGRLVPGEPAPLDRCETTLLARHYGVTPEELLSKLRELIPSDLEQFVTADRHMLPCEIVQFVRTHFTPVSAKAFAASQPVDAEVGAGAVEANTPASRDGHGGSAEGGDEESEGSGRRRRRRRRGRGRGRGDDDGPVSDAPARPVNNRAGHEPRSTASEATGAFVPTPTPPPAPEPAAATAGVTWKPLRSLYGAAMRRLRPGESGGSRES
ncbi:MAG: Rne/Rng family ribonuclease [Planctomycetota bacterium]|nr:Rne/Rng family ribonuclease [Planctomycetota bacterium]